MNRSKPREVLRLALLVTLIPLSYCSLKSPVEAEAPGQTAQRTVPLPPTQENLALGLNHFDEHCASCHGPDGKAGTEKGNAVHAADLTSPDVQSMSDAELFRVIYEGKFGTAMPAFGNTHSAASIRQIVTFLRKLPTLSADERAKLEAAIPANAPHHHAELAPGTHEHADQPSQKQDQGGAAQPPEHQHDMSNMDQQKAEHPPQPEHDMSKMNEHAGHDMSGMTGSHDMNSMMSSISGGPFKTMAAIGSGSSLLPSSSPMSMYHWMKGDWMLMAHFNAIVDFDHQGGPRGVNKADSMNWLMFMAEHPVEGGGRLLLRGMFSAEPFTSTNGGFPELFQTGETWRGRPIIDAQHPHNLFMELSATLTMPLSERASVFVYGGPVGEPALGPAAFMHRDSASENPAAPLGHHWQDSTHISFGVVTAGLNLGKFRVEGSVFRGEEPNEHRKTIQLGKLDSYSGRIWFTPTPNWAFQFSHGRLHHPEILETGDTVRTSASASYNRAWRDGNWASSLIWGRNHEDRGNSNAYLFESTVNFLDKNYIYTREELVDKPGLLEENIFGRDGTDQFHSIGNGLEVGNSFEQAFRIGAFTFGGVRDVVTDSKLRVGIGADVTFYHVTDPLHAIYGASPKSFHIFIRLRPGKMAH
jgi:mono/diheme cytochrome c family protein